MHLPKHLSQWDSQPVFKNETDHTLRCPAQRERVTRAGRLFANSEKSRQRIDFVGQRRYHTDGCGRARIIGAERLIVLGNGICDALILAVVKSVIAPHDPLQFGELADYAGR